MTTPLTITGRYDRHMRRALQLAAQAYCSPNPQVGCVIVKDSKVIGEGFHKGPGTPHAEPTALARAGTHAKGATLIVTLEPCDHQGRTPPCTSAIIAAGISKLVYGTADPTHGGAERLRKAGILVERALPTGCDTFLASWLKYATTSAPWVVLKAATSLDGNIAEAKGMRTTISCPEALEHSKKQRNSFDAILVGANTVRVDDPELASERGITRVILGCDIPPDAKVLRDSNALAYCKHTDAAHVSALQQHGAKLVAIDPHDIHAVLADLASRGIARLLVEGGADIYESFLAADAIDELRLYVSPRLLPGGVRAFNKEPGFRLIESRRLGTDTFMRMRRSE
ncbi:riboflavin biosynthesis protein RibD [Candidatus Woesearchaeota archaeon CG1_02_57_44]|nr:MAG: riboflavin biosynthesis protein RibD [Candidatus Woesearchaeota archaeon CG1_02_57_44]PIN70502.1 MAG: riboflavin biosynthesis protein RibD [Candidatus Woesearchaeota archaeon CG11_big_fil_rev_8_21_14_0_20_57_5]